MDGAFVFGSGWKRRPEVRERHHFPLRPGDAAAPEMEKDREREGANATYLSTVGAVQGFGVLLVRLLHGHEGSLAVVAHVRLLTSQSESL